MKQRQIVVVGASFAGYTAALTIAQHTSPRDAGTGVKITVISNTNSFLFLPSLVWLPFVERKYEDISFPLRPPLEQAGINLVIDEVQQFDLRRKVVVTSAGLVNYDRLLIATGPKVDFAAIPGLGPDPGYSSGIFTFEQALQTQRAWQQLLKNPGPVVVGTTQSASCYGAGYKFVLNLAHQVKAHCLEDRIHITYVTAESSLDHSNVVPVESDQARAEALFKQMGIEWRAGQGIDHVEKGKVVLSDGERLPFALAMIVPPFTGVNAVKTSDNLGDKLGFIHVDDCYRVIGQKDVFAAGVAVADSSQLNVVWGIPLSEVMARIAAYNLAADITGCSAPITIPICEVVGGKRQAVPMMDQYPLVSLPNRDIVVPSPEVRSAQSTFERHFLAARKAGWI